MSKKKDTTQETFEVSMWSLNKIKPYHKNAKTHHVDRIAKSIEKFKIDQPIVVDQNGIIIKGHGRLKAAKKLGLKKFPVIVREDLTPEQVRLARIADNRVAEGGWDANMLEADLTDLNLDGFDFDIGDLGINDEWFKELDISIDVGSVIIPGHNKANLNKVPPPPEPADVISKLGDVWRLGRHRVMCGSSTEIANVNTLMAGKSVDMLLTDPPYNVDYSSKNDFLNSHDKGNQTPILNDKIENFLEFCVSFLKSVPFAKYNTVYCFIPGKEIHTLIKAYEDAGLYYSQNLTWVKNNHVLGRMDYKPRSEDIIYGWKGRHKFYGEFTTDVLEFPKPQKSELHPTMKPVDLLCKLINDGSKAGALVYDAFGGSGSTLIACEETGRTCRTMELSPAYVDVIVKRWEDLTGKKATRLNKDEGSDANLPA